MLTKEQNERLTQVGPGTPGGELLRRYWQVLCPAGEITEEPPKKRVRLLGEDLLVYRGDDGAMYCIEEHCPHRGASLFYGFVEPGGIRCCYHGWKYDADGQCLEQPFEPKQHARQSASAASLSGAEARRAAVRLYGPRSGARAAAAALGRAGARGRPPQRSSCCRCTTATGCRSRRTRSIPCTPTICTATCRR